MLNPLSILNRRKRPKRWRAGADEVPWFDRPDAVEQLERRFGEGRVSEEHAKLLRKWLEDGYFVVDGVISEADIDEMLGDLDAIWTAAEPIEGLEVLGACRDESDPVARPHADLLAMSEAERFELRDTTPWRVHGFYRHSAASRRIHENRTLMELTSLIFDHPAERDSTINFMYGSRQSLHQDTTVFHVFPANYLAGVWLACEDVSPDSGPLVYYPGSHAAPMFERFDNYPQTSLKTCDAAATEAYEKHLEELSGRFERKQFLAKKGQVLIWHGMLSHGGDAVIDPARTRKSYVCHYIGQGMNKAGEIVGPFNW